MPPSTTIRVSAATRDELRRLAAAESISLDELLRHLARAERQRRIGIELAAAIPDADDEAWLEVAAETVRNHR